MNNLHEVVPRIWGYARASRNHQIKSPEVQHDLIRAKAEQLEQDDGARWARCRVDEGTSATKTRWNDRQRRPELGKLLQEMNQGDHLVIWRLDRLERSPFGMVHALEFLVNRGVNIHVLEHGGMQLDLDTAMGRLLVMILAGFAGFFSDQLGEAIRAGKAWRKERGLAYHSHPPPGHIRVKRLATNPKSQRKYDLFDIWDYKQCDLIREIKYRSDKGERMADIAEDFRQRDERMWNGKPWTQNYGTRKRVNLTRYYRAYWFVTELQAEGKDLMGIPCIPGAQERAKWRLGNKQRRFR